MFGDFLIPFYSSEQPVFNKLSLGWQLRANIKLELLVLHLFLGFAGPAALLPFAGEHAKLRTICDPGWWAQKMVPCSLALLDSSALRTLTSRGKKEMGGGKHSEFSTLTLPSFTESWP